MLERMCHENATFVTLTYADEHLPSPCRSGAHSLVPHHMSDFMKRLRSRIEPLKVRFFGVGEYGQDVVGPDGIVYGRPHYHLALFGVPHCRWDVTRRLDFYCCDVCELLKDVWGLGHVYSGRLEPQSAAYVAGYVLKKSTLSEDFDREPVFIRMSNRPGIGAVAAEAVVATLRAHGLDTLSEDVPQALRHGGKEWPLGRYMRGRIRIGLGRAPTAPQGVMDAIEAELLPLRLAAKASSVNPSFKNRVTEAGEAKRLALVALSEIFRQKRVLQ